MKELIERLERATGPDRELDAELHSIATGDALFCPWDGEYAEFIRHNETTYVLPSDDGSPLPAYTASLDAARSLYKQPPERIPVDPIAACVEALRQWQ